MRKYLLPKKGHYYKANLHGHSVLSDGTQTPEELKRLYKENGYSVLAITDHDFLRPQNELSDENFIMLTAYEIDIRNYKSDIHRAVRKAVHLNLFAKNQDNTTFIGFHPETVKHLVKRGTVTEDEIKKVKYAGELRELYYSPDIVNNIIKSARENGYLVSLNHPAWSLINYSDYSNYEGIWAVEIYNNECAKMDYSDDEHVYEEMLRLGKHVFCTATDDNHSPAGTLGGFTMIKSESFDYSSIISAMERGDFYASSGPEIYELYYEDGSIHIECSPVTKISILTIGRRRATKFAKDGELLTSADFKIDPERYGYIRLRITDSSGKSAWTNAYYVDELMENAVSFSPNIYLKHIAAHLPSSPAPYNLT